jgi:hypothetical protein
MYDNSCFVFYDSNPTCGNSFVMQYFQMQVVSRKSLVWRYANCSARILHLIDLWLPISLNIILIYHFRDKKYQALAWATYYLIKNGKHQNELLLLSLKCKIAGENANKIGDKIA